MLASYIALGLFSSVSAAPGTGEVTAAAERTVVLLAVQANSPAITGLPTGAVAWQQPYDPGDHAPYAIDFGALLEVGEQIAAIEEITMNATAALLGVGVDAETDYAPIIDTDGEKIQMWFVVDEASWAESSFNAGGVKLPVTARVLTDSTPPKRYERTGVLTMRQL